MRIQVSYGGGFAGDEVLLGDVDTTTLGPRETARITEALSSLERAQEDADIGADMFEYRIHVVSDDGERTLRVTDAGDPTAVKAPALQDFLRALGVG